MKSIYIFMIKVSFDIMIDFMKKQRTVRKRRRYVVKKERSDINLDIIIKSLLDQYTFIRERDLIKLVVKQSGRSDITVMHRLSSLKEEGEIIIIENADLKKYGIKEASKKAVYVASKEILMMRDHIVEVFKLLRSKNVNDVKIGVRELRNIQTNPQQRYVLYQEQIDTISYLLADTNLEGSFKDDTLRYDLLALIDHELLRHKLKPSDKQTFVETLKSLLEQYPTSNYDAQANSPLPHLMHLLGVYMNSSVIDRLEHDAENIDPQKFGIIEQIYSNWYEAKLIEDNKTRLMKFEAKLQEKGKLEAIEFIERLRRGAGLNLQGSKGSPIHDMYEKSSGRNDEES
jgi:hypothetical protein